MKENQLLLQWKMEGAPIADTKFDLLLKILKSPIFQLSNVSSSWKTLQKTMSKCHVLVSFNYIITDINKTMTSEKISNQKEELLYFPILDIIQMQCSNAANWEMFQFHFKHQTSFKDLNSGNWWKVAEEKMKRMCRKGGNIAIYVNFIIDTLLFPQILYADSAIIYTLRNKAVHLVYLIPAALPLKQRLQQRNRYLWAYISNGISISKSFELLGFYDVSFLLM